MAGAVLISGASRGLGLATARELAARGREVFAGVRKPGSLPASTGAREVLLDVTSNTSVGQAVHSAVKAAGGLDALVNNAGLHAFGALETASEERFRELLEVNLLGAWRLARAVLPHMRSRGSGHILMVSSLSAKVGLPGDGQYAASKFALEGMSESLALEVRRFGIQVTLLHPGPYNTDMLKLRGSFSKRTAPSAGGEPYAALHRALLERPPKGEPPQEAARAIADLIDSPPAALRCPVGPLAKHIFKRLDIDPGERGERVALDATGLRWWVQGEERE